MFLGVVLHAALSYLTFDAVFTPAWDQSRSGAFDIACFAIHAFRMQAFFVVAGYFAALGLERRGVGEFLRARGLRIALPLAVGAVTIVPLVTAQFLIAKGHPLHPLWLVAAPAHLWFLLYLLVFSLLAAVWRATIERRALGKGGVLARVAASAWAVPVLMLPTAAINLLMPQWIIETPWAWIPSPVTLLYYGLFFSTGFALRRSGGLARAGRAWPILLPLAVLVLLPALLVIGPGMTPALVARFGHSGNVPAALVQGAFTWSMVFGLLGVLTRVCAHPRPWVRWLADASYWVYLVHLPVVYYLQRVLVDWRVPGMSIGPAEAFVKFAIILGLTIVFCLLTYAVLIRPTPLERVIGGGRPRRPSAQSALGAGIATAD